MLNRCDFIGRLGADPECKRMQSGNPVVNFSLAVSKKWRDKNGDRQEKTTWVPVVIFNEGLCGVAEKYLRKGSMVFVSGEFSVRKWQDQSGQDKYTTECVLQGFDSKMIMLDGKPSDNQPSQSSDFGKPGGGADFDDAIPFAPEWRA